MASDGTVITVAGTGTQGFSGDGGPATSAELAHPTGVALDGAGNLYIADLDNHRVRKVSAADSTIATVAGTGTADYAGDGLPAVDAHLWGPVAVAYHGGELYIADTGNTRVRKVAADGTISTVAGDGNRAYAGDGVAATTTAVNKPMGLAFDTNGNLYVAENGNSRIRKVDGGGTISTFAGTGAAGSGGDGGAATAAQLNHPIAIGFDAGGNLYIADADNQRIRKVDTGNKIATFAGSGTAGYSGDGGLATLARLNNPSAVAFDTSGRVYVADQTNNRIRRVFTVPASAFALSLPANATVGSPVSLTVTARDAYGNTEAGYTGTVHFTSSDGVATLPGDATLINGVGIFSATFKSLGNQTLTATDTVDATITGTSGAVAVGPGAATHFAVSAPANAVAGSPVSVTVTALDAFDNTASGYAGTVRFTSSDGVATLPSDTNLIAGTGGLSVTFKTAGSHTVTATDTVSASITGTSGTVAVAAGNATHFSVSAPANASAGSAVSVSVTALDAFNNTANGYAGTVHFTSSDGVAVLPSDSALASGTGSFSVTLKSAGSRTITATDTVSASITGTSGTVAVAAGNATHFSVSAPANATAGSAVSVSVTALDAFNNTAGGYAGTVHFTSSDGAALVPIDSTLASGTGSFSVTLKSAGNRTITATDTVTGSITGTSNAVSVAAGSATRFVVSAPGSATAGNAVTVTATAQDAAGNTVTGYAGTVHFTSSDGTAMLPANTPLTNGTGSFPVTFKTSGNRIITATDTVSASITGTSGTVAVAAGNATHFSVSAPANAMAGSAVSFTVTAQDAFGNAAARYTGTVHFTSNDPVAQLPSDSTLAGGAGSFSVTLKSPGNRILTASDTATGSITGTSAAITVASAVPLLAPWGLGMVGAGLFGLAARRLRRRAA